MRKIISTCGLTISFLLPQIVSAHSFGVLYNLPVPFWMYLYGGAAAMVVSFLFVGYFFNRRSVDLSYPTIHLSKPYFFQNFEKSFVLELLKTISVFLLFLTILSGLVGENSSYSNFSMTFFWIIFVLGFTYLTAIVGNIYTLLNPWKVITSWLVDEKEKPIFEYPKWLGYYPAFLFYFIFIWIELVGNSTPFTLSIILVVYTIINNLGSVLFGVNIWFRYCEFFSVFFRLIGKMSPVERINGKFYLRPPFVALIKEKAEHFSLLMFVLFMLSSTAFDGFKETLPWSRIYWGYFDNIIRPIFGTSSYGVFQIIGILLSPFVFLAVYYALIGASKLIAKSNLSFKDLALQFAFSLIPIAFVYNVAHYFSLIFSEGPNIIRLISDPFGFGWDLFNTADYFGSVVLEANIVWHLQVTFILIGHIVGVYLTHKVSLNVFSLHKKAFWSQVPMLILMILYTIVGLWILSQPITN